MNARQMAKEDAKFQMRVNDEWLDENGELTLEKYSILSNEYNAKLKEHHIEGTYILCKNNTTKECFEFSAGIFSPELRKALLSKKPYIEPLCLDIY